MSLQRSSSNLLFVGVLGAIGAVYLVGLLILERPDSRRVVPAEVGERLEAEVRTEESERGSKPPAPATDGPTEADPGDPLEAPARPDTTTSELEPTGDPKRWQITGRIELPATSPTDETLRLVARPTAPATLYEPWNPPDWNDHAEGERAESFVSGDGTFALALPPHWDEAFLELSGRYLFFDEPLQLVREVSGETPPLVLRPRLGAWVRGRILDAEGQGLAESFVRRARVSAVPDLDALRDALARGGLDTLVTERLSSRPADDGSYELRGVPPRTRFLVAPVAEGLLPGHARGLDAQPGAELTLDFRMARGRTVRGRLTDPEGLGLSGARVSYRGELELDGFAPLFGPWVVLDTTDESGRFELRGLPERAELPLSCELEGWVLPEPLVADTTGEPELVVRLERGHVIEGRVQWADGRPAPGFDVRLARRSRTFRSLTTDEDGRFRAIGLDSEPFSLTASGVERLGPGHSRVSWQSLPEVDPATSGLLVTLPMGATLAGRVRTVSGESLEAYELECMPLEVEGGAEGYRVPFELPRESSEPGTPEGDEPVLGPGHFRIEGLKEGLWSVVVRARGYAETRPRILALPHPATDELEPFELMATSSATGTILGPDGLPVAGARLRSLVSWQDEGGQTRSASAAGPTEWRSDVFGRFRVSELAPGTYRWIASAPGHANSRAVELIVPAGRRIEGLEISLREGGWLTGELLDEHDHPVAGRFISVARADFLDARTGHTDELGRFSFRELEPGKWRVYALPEGKAGGRDAPLEELALSSEVLIHDGDESHVVLGGRPEPEILVGHLYGSVLDDGGRPEEGARVVLSEHGALATRSPYGARLLQSETDVEGRFAFESLPLGTYHLCAFPLEGSGLAPHIVRDLRIEEEPPGAGELELELERGGSLSGRVVDSEGLPISGASIFVRDSEGLVLAHISELVSDEQGRFRYPALLTGRYTVLARTQDGSSEESEALFVSPGEDTATEIVLVPGTLLFVQLRTETGQARPARVLVCDREGRRVNGLVGMETFLREIESGFSDSEQTVGPLAPGTYHVTATLEDGRRVEETAELSGEPLERLVLQVE